MAGYDVIIVGGGISGLSALHFIKRNKPELSVHLFEADKRPGGTIGTDHIEGYSFDWGPNGFLDREPLTLQLCDELGLDAKIERANPNVSKRFILRKGKLRQVPMAPPKFMLSDILSVKGKLRVASEPIVKKKRKVDDESIYDFASRRIGREAADYLVQPMVSGVYGGVADRLSLKACFPVMREMEDKYGSLFKAMIAKKKEAKQNDVKSGGPAGPAGWLTTFYGGLDVLTETMADKYSDLISYDHKAISAKKTKSGYKVTFDDSNIHDCDKLIIATPSYIASQITESLSEKLSKALGDIPYSPIAVVCMGYDDKAISYPLDGFGFLVPQKEKRKILGSIWTSSIFENRAPSGKVQFRTMVGGDGDHETPKFAERELERIVHYELNSILGISELPEITKIFRWEKGIPQYYIGHNEIMKQIEEELNEMGDIYLTGNAYYGISLNHCVSLSYKLSQKI